MKKLLAQLAKLNIKVKSSTPSEPGLDAEIQLDGDKHKDVSIQVGRGYYIVNKWDEKAETMFHVDGKGDLNAEIEKVLTMA